ncbi:lipid-A-disaccharide synthase [Tahibacter amnicola]|uniref:Lipid-A-disaccharide synthase n=1 Tax=Tahibacter amnicola TaxID=2976241 RepID=A0ABY6BDW0_9GAMM|nr:lipid-A-disaccharide synthase [Tahibacter amnicola]UXI66806.1 lipid-A-disaccharide synthase [Tahibacter amnicola]
MNPTESAPRPRLFALVAGEASGDLLGADLIRALRVRYPDARFVGIGGDQMIAAGLEAWYPAEKLSVMGLVEVLKHLAELLRIRADVSRRIQALKPDAFIGIDAPDFNLGLEKKLKTAGIRTVHYVSPSVWAWREGRAAKIGRSADVVLCLFPMEPPIYARYHVTARFVGHPLADRFPLVNEHHAARRTLGLSDDAPVLALLPGSRLGEIERLGAIFIEAARRCAKAIPGLQIVAPMATEACRARFSALMSATPDTDDAQPDTPIRLLDGNAHLAMQAADVVLLASGTAALEAMLAKRPMVVAYKVAAWTYRLVTWFKLMRTTRFSLPNVLAGRELVPEILQDACTAPALADALLQLFGDASARMALLAEFERLHRTLHGAPGSHAADVVSALVEGRPLDPPSSSDAPLSDSQRAPLPPH